MKRFALSALALTLASCVFVPAVFAADFTVPMGVHAEIRGEGPGSSSKITTDDTSISCGLSSFILEGFEGSATHFDVNPFYSKCVAEIFGSKLVETIVLTGCKIRFSVDKQLKENLYAGTMGIVAASENCVNEEIYVERTNCRWSFPAQEGHATVEYSNSEGTSNTVTANLWVTGLEYSLSGFGCLAPAGEYTDGAWHETVTFSAWEKESQVDFEVK
jgi:hypothetical protein